MPYGLNQHQDREVPHHILVRLTNEHSWHPIFANGKNSTRNKVKLYCEWDGFKEPMWSGLRKQITLYFHYHNPKISEFKTSQILISELAMCSEMSPWASCQIWKIAGCACAGNAGNVFPPPTSKETTTKRSRHASRHVRHARAVMHVGIAKPRWRGKRSWHSRCIRNPQFYVSGKRPIAIDELTLSTTSQNLTLFTITRMRLFHIPQCSI